MTHIDEPRLESDLGYPFDYVSRFIGLDVADVAVIHGAAPKLAPLVPALVDAVYNKLIQQEQPGGTSYRVRAGTRGKYRSPLTSLQWITRKSRSASSTLRATSRPS